MKRDWWPPSFEDKKDWLHNYSDEIAGVGLSIGMTTAQTTAEETFVAPLITKIDAVIATKNAYEMAVGDWTNSFDDSTEAELRRRVNAEKAMPGWSVNAGNVLKTNTTGGPPAVIQPNKLRAQISHGNVRLFGVKNGAERVNIYARIPGGAWVLIGAKMQKLPFDDDRPPVTPGAKSEDREYMLMGVVGDAEVGLPSGILHATWIA